MGQFSNENPPIRSGSYVRWLAKQQESLPVSTGSIVAVPFTHDWGPFKTPVLVNSFAEFVAIFGRGEVSYTEGFLAVYNAFKGEGPDVAPGAGAVLCYRHGGASAAKAALTLQDTAGVPHNVIRLRARYEGTGGNALKIEVVANVRNPGTQKDINIYRGTQLLETYTVLNGDVQGLADLINGAAGGDPSGFVTADQVNVQSDLANIAPTALVGGNDGATLLAADWTDTLDAMVAQRFAVFVPANLTDTSLVAAIDAWQNGLNNRQKAKRFETVFGGALDEGIGAAKTRTGTLNDENVANWGVGSYRDTDLTDGGDSAGLVQSTAQMAPRLAGIITRRGIGAAISFATLQNVEIVSGPTDDDIVDAIENGVITVGLGSQGVRFERGVTTYTGNSVEKPKKVWGTLKYAFTAQNFERDINERNEAGQIVGKLRVNRQTREVLVGNARSIVDDYVRDGGFQKPVTDRGEGVYVSKDPPPTDDQDFVALDWVLRFSRTVEQVRNTVYVS